MKTQTALFKMPLLVALAALTIDANSATAQGLGDSAKGRAYAAETCAQCHAIDSGNTRSPIPEAIPLQTIANTPGITATAIVVWLRTPHPTMPNLIISPDDQRDLAAYIMTLKTPQ